MLASTFVPRRLHFPAHGADADDPVPTWSARHGIRCVLDHQLVEKRGSIIVQRFHGSAAPNDFPDIDSAWFG